MVDGISKQGIQPTSPPKIGHTALNKQENYEVVFKRADKNSNGQIDADELGTLNDLLKSLEEDASSDEPQAGDAETSATSETAENKTHKLTVNYKDTWYGIVQAKYGIKDHKQTMEIIRQLKAQNNVNPKATNMPKEIELPDIVTLKDGSEVKLADIDAEVDKSHWQAKPKAPAEQKVVSQTGRYTITKNGVTKYYAADGTELKQSYYEAKEAAASARNVSKNGTGRYSYTASNGETWYFAADGTAITKDYYERRETEHTVLHQQKNISQAARTSFKQQLDEDGWAGKTADALSVLWGSDNRASKVEADLQAYDNQIKALQQASKKGAIEFNTKFKELYGVNYNPANIAEYEKNPTPENYRKAYGTKNDIHKRVMDYNQSQKDGAAAVKTTVVVAASAAAAVATGGASLVVTAGVAAASTAAARMAVEVSDLATNNVDGDVNSENLTNIAEQAAVEGVISGVTAGAVKGIGGLMSKGASKAVTAETGLVRTEQNAVTGGLVRAEQQGTSAVTKSVAKAEAGAANSAKAGAANTGTAGAGNAANAGAAAGAETTGNATAASTREFIKDIGSKVSSRGGLSNLTAAERTKLSEIIGTDVSKISTMSKSELRQLAMKFHPDKAPAEQVELYKEIFQIIGNIK